MLAFQAFHRQIEIGLDAGVPLSFDRRSPRVALEAIKLQVETHQRDRSLSAQELDDWILTATSLPSAYREAFGRWKRNPSLVALAPLCELEHRKQRLAWRLSHSAFPLFLMLLLLIPFFYHFLVEASPEYDLVYEINDLEPTSSLSMLQYVRERVGTFTGILMLAAAFLFAVGLLSKWFSRPLIGSSSVKELSSDPITRMALICDSQLKESYWKGAIPHVVTNLLGGAIVFAYAGFILWPWLQLLMRLVEP